MDIVSSFIDSFLVFHVNAFYAIVYFLQNNFFFLFVIVAIFYLVLQELIIKNGKYVDDERRII